MELQSLNVAVAYGRLVLTCRDCDDEVEQFEPGKDVPLEDVVSAADAAEHECGDSGD